MKKTTFLIAGKHAVTEALKNPNRKVLKVFLIVLGAAMENKLPAEKKLRALHL